MTEALLPRGLRPRDACGWATLCYLLAVLLLGGASGAGALANFALQMAGAALAGWALARGAAREPTALRRALFVALGLALVQFVPLPPSLWRELPGRAPIAQGFALLGEPLPWLPLGLAPGRALAALAWVIPALAIWLALRRPQAPRALAVRLVIAVALLSVPLGLAQQISGRGYSYAITNYGLGPAFFANANHQSDFLLLALALWFGTAWPDARARLARRGGAPAETFAALALVLAPLLLIVGVVANQSLACLALLGPLLLAGAVIDRPAARLVWPAAAIVTVSVALSALVLLAPLGNDLTGASGEAGISRHDFWRTGLVMLRDHWPVGIGLGGFPARYGWYEDPDRVGGTFVNHAHNDWLELLVDTGVFGLVLLLVALAALARLVARAWRGTDPRARAAALMIITLSLHSLVDYPLRTAALSALFALACVLIEARAEDREG
ncbi:MAG: O-antigen ligase family protein [Sphingomonas sp.]|nr:O-antigen ligase family protein [Sphingomonas sp.]